MIPKKRRRNKSVDRAIVGYSCRSYHKYSHNIDYRSNVATDTTYQYEYAVGGSYTRISKDTIQPYTTVDADKYKDRATRGTIKGFSHRSRGRFLDSTTKINKSKVNPKATVFITLK